MICPRLPSGYSDKAYFVFSGGTLALEDSAGGGLITDSGAQSGGKPVAIGGAGSGFPSGRDLGR